MSDEFLCVGRGLKLINAHAIVRHTSTSIKQDVAEIMSYKAKSKESERAAEIDQSR